MTEFVKISFEVNTRQRAYPPDAIDEVHPAALHSAMAHAEFLLTNRHPTVVGSFGSSNDLQDAQAPAVLAACDLVEIRLDIVMPHSGAVDSAPWRQLRAIPLLFTARRQDEGGVRHLNAVQRMDLIAATMDDAALIDLEVASLGEMEPLVKTLITRRIPWIASFHDFEKLPDHSVLETAAQHAKSAGACGFKLAARLNRPADIARLAEFQLADHGLPVATMGMGPLAPVSRLLCAQCGSVLNYGYLGHTPSAPGQWEAAALKHAIANLTSIAS